MLSFFPLDVLDEIADLIESFYEGFLTYSFILPVFVSLISAYAFTHFSAAIHNRSDAKYCPRNLCKSEDNTQLTKKRWENVGNTLYFGCENIVI